MNDLSGASKMLMFELERLRTRTQIAELCSEYGNCCDNSDLAGLMALFTEHASVEIPAFGATARGRSAIEELYRAQFSDITASNHWTHDLVVKVSADGDTASGRVAGHAEVARGNIVFIAALRYEDEYEAIEGRWFICSRRLLFSYYMPVTEFGNRFGARDRIWTATGWMTGNSPQIKDT